MRLRELLGDKPGIGLCFVGLAAVACAVDRVPLAAQLLGAAEKLRGVTGAALPAAERAEPAETLEAVRRGLSGEALSAAWARGRGVSLGEAVAAALEVTASPAQG